MRERRWLLLALYGLLLAIAVSDAIKASRVKFKIATTSTTSTTTEQPDGDEGSDDEKDATTTIASTDTNGTTGHTLTGIPQIDYIWDPNLPRELNGYNLSEYPFYNSIPNPEEIDFKCDGLHDGFYASVPHKCQVYHHCLYGTRYDFLCANFTAFDQRNFICHFVSEVDCANSKKYWHRNDALYQTASSSTSSTTSTTTTTTTTTTTAAPPPSSGYSNEDRFAVRERDSALPSRDPPPPPPRRRRPIMRRPIYDYYDDEYYDDDYDLYRVRGHRDREYDEYDVPSDRKSGRRDRDRDYRDRYRERDREYVGRDRFAGRMNRRDPPSRNRNPADEELRQRNRDQDSSRTREFEDRVRDGEGKRSKDNYEEKDPAPLASVSSTENVLKPAKAPASVYARPKVSLKIRRPVPLSEQEKYALSTTTVQPTSEEPRKRITTTTTTALPLEDEEDDDYYEDEIEEVRPRWQMRGRPYRDRDYYDKRYRDRHFRSRYREEEEDIRPRKYPERSRDRYYERERERIPERMPVRDRMGDRMKERNREYPRLQQPEKMERSNYHPRPAEREREIDRPNVPHRLKDQSEVPEPPQKTQYYERTTTHKTTSTTLSEDYDVEDSELLPEDGASDSHQTGNYKKTEPDQYQDYKIPESTTTSTESSSHKYWKPNDQANNSPKEIEEKPVDYSSSEYYDDAEEAAIPQMAPQKPTARFVKRPSVPMRVGSSQKKEETYHQPTVKSTERPHTTSSGFISDDEDVDVDKDYRGYKEPVNVYKQPQPPPKQQDQRYSQQQEPYRHADNYNYPINRVTARKPEPEAPKKYSETYQASTTQKPWPDWKPQSTRTNNRQNPIDPSHPLSSSHKSEPTQELSNINNYQAKQKINEVYHPRLQDIPESEYDVTLNEALSPNLNQEQSHPTGFVLPIQRQFNRDTVLQPSENTYKFSVPISQPHHVPRQQKNSATVITSQSFMPYTGISRSGNTDRSKNFFYKAPETIQISASHYRPQRTQWSDYTGF